MEEIAQVVALFAVVVYLGFKTFLAVLIYRRAAQISEAVTADDSVIRAQVDAVRTEEQRAMERHISAAAEKRDQNMDTARRGAAERMGTRVGMFQAKLIAQELKARREHRASLFGVAAGILGKA